MTEPTIIKIVETSTKKPFCDGTHSRIGFRGAVQAVQESDKF